MPWCGSSRGARKNNCSPCCGCSHTHSYSECHRRLSRSHASSTHSCACALSQALPACKGRPDDQLLEHKQTLIWKDGDSICIRILRRKNRPGGSGVLRRICSCSGGQHLCVVHALWGKFFENLPNGSEPWRNVTSGMTRERLRRALHTLRVPDAGKFGSQDFRRGHAEVCHALVHDGSYACCARVDHRI